MSVFFELRIESPYGARRLQGPIAVVSRQNYIASVDRRRHGLAEIDVAADRVIHVKAENKDVVAGIVVDDIVLLVVLKRWNVGRINGKADVSLAILKHYQAGALLRDELQGLPSR